MAVTLQWHDATAWEVFAEPAHLLLVGSRK